MAEEEIKSALLDYTILERRKTCREELRRKKESREDFLPMKGKAMRRKEELSEEESSLLRRTLLMAANQHNEKSMELPDVVPAIGVSIGKYSRFTGKDVTVTAIFFYKTRRLQWEIVEGPLRHGLEVEWDHIVGLELKLNECGLACLTLEVNHPPDFMKYYPELKEWSSIRNFTDDDEISYNLPPHYVVFKPGIVDESYEALLNYRKEEAVLLKEKHFQKMLRLRKKYSMSEKQYQFLESKRHRQLEKEENK